MKSALLKWMMVETTEFDLIKKYFTPENWRKDVLLGVGDDCALLSPPGNKQLAVTVDTLIAGVHFPVETSAEDIAYKSIAVSLSDLAAMGAEPAWVTLALTLPEVESVWLSDFSHSFSKTLEQFNVQLVGGDTTRGSLSITVHATGFIDENGAMQRNSAKAGDAVFITGALGDAGLGLLLSERASKDNSFEYFFKKLNRPQPRVEFALAAAKFCNAAIDISDGLSADLGHILSASHCGAIINLEDLPLSDELMQYFKGEKKSPDWDMILAGGDDYELCVIVPPVHTLSLITLAESMNLRLTRIGEITSENKFNVLRPDGRNYNLNKSGYDHFQHG